MTNSASELPLDPNSPWYSVFVNTIGFILGFALGGLSGYLGNWLWFRFGPTRNCPHLSTTQNSETATFSGVMTHENKDDIIKTLKSIQVRPPEDSSVTSTSREGLIYQS